MSWESRLAVDASNWQHIQAQNCKAKNMCLRFSANAAMRKSALASRPKPIAMRPLGTRKSVQEISQMFIPVDSIAAEIFLNPLSIELGSIGPVSDLGTSIHPITSTHPIHPIKISPP
jgi:hypothetical protein